MFSRVAQVAFAAIIVLLLSACSDDDGGNGPSALPTATGNSTQAAVTAGTAPATNLTIPQVVRRVGPSVVAVLVHSSDGGGEGSGVIWDGKGNIVTNNHVVEGATSIVVELRDGQRLQASLVATDPLTDLAVVKVGRLGLPPATFASFLPAAGERAIAIGSPLGFENTVTAGIVSGVGRSIPGSGSASLVDLLQTDAAISPGNSGGALVGAQGQVIGINVAYIPPQQGAVALGFAVPAPTVKSVVPFLASGKRVRHAYLGVNVSELSAPDAAKLGTTQAGLAVMSVQPRSAAAAASIRRGDVIVSFDGKRIRTLDQLLSALRRRQPEQTVSLRIARAGAVRRVDVTLGDYAQP
jgi:serine protease DegQ